MRGGCRLWLRDAWAFGLVVGLVGEEHPGHLEAWHVHATHANTTHPSIRAGLLASTFIEVMEVQQLKESYDATLVSQQDKYELEEERGLA
jgi:hypothetical protein